MNVAVIKSKDCAKGGEFYLSQDAPLLVIIVNDVQSQKEVKKLTVGLKGLPLNFRIILIDDTKARVPDLKNSYHVSKKEAEKFFTFAHMVLFSSKKPSKMLVKAAISNGAVPIVCGEVDYLKNYTGPTEAGNSFKFSEMNSWGMYAAVVRALENFGFPYDWKNIIKSAKDIL
ncbi:MAG: hypothetical protein Q8P68_06230 [Candidatus Peregrinibacteria bacterium]|nr:hypothetical protein [Candidatus Peregrinibacteria bacterium]MDZ4245138.1 hypothetical protein [Candidatus Gracilibacteria bacterium]